MCTLAQTLPAGLDKPTIARGESRRDERELWFVAVLDFSDDSYLAPSLTSSWHGTDDSLLASSMSSRARRVPGRPRIDQDYSYGQRKSLLGLWSERSPILDIMSPIRRLVMCCAVAVSSPAPERK
jgi:hypothetical protein